MAKPELDYRQFANPRLGVRYGQALIGDDDPAELFHEASGRNRRYQLRDKVGVRQLEMDPAFRNAVAHPGKRHPYADLTELPEVRLPGVGLQDAITSRESTREYGLGALGQQELANVLFVGYGQLESDGEGSRRTVPSGGGLYPLDMYVVNRSVEGLGPGLYRYEPTLHATELLTPEVGVREIGNTLVHPEIAETAACFVILVATFWRSRFKYGLRGYRFVLIEAGHAMQNIVLAAAAMGIGVVPVGGFFDHELAEMLEVDGVTEAPLYLAALGPAVGDAAGAAGSRADPAGGAG